MPLDALHSIRDAHARQTAADTKRTILDTRYTIRDAHARQAAAATERILPDARHTLRDAHARQAAAVTERIPLDARHPLRDAHARQAAAAPEGTLTDALHSIRDAHARQAAAATERILPDARHPLRKLYLCQLQARIKRIITDIRHSRLHNHRSDLRLLAIPGRHRRRAVIRHGPIAGNSQHTVLSQYPVQLFATFTGSNSRQLLQRLRFYRGLGLTCFVLVDLAATGTGVVFVITWGGVGRCNRLGFGHGVAQCGKRFRRPRCSLCPRLIFERCTASCTDIISRITGLGTGSRLG